MPPFWLHALATGYLAFGAVCAVVIAIDEVREPQRTWIMNLVWPVTALFGAGWIAWQYFRYGKPATARKPGSEPRRGGAIPSWIEVANGTLHCGAGCTIGDICAETLLIAFPAVAVAFGRHAWFTDRIFAAWILDYLFAYAFGIFFQYFTIAPMRGLKFPAGIAAAIKADTLSLTAWQMGMYGFVAVAHFFIFPSMLGVKLQAGSVEFWFVMQIAMTLGFLTSFPVNWWLIRRGIKESM
jgi:hypothetical protein